MKAVITVIGQDNVGIIAKVSGKCYEHSVNILDISQSVIQEYFAMIMLVDISFLEMKFSEFVDKMSKYGEENSLKIHTMHEDIFNSMHRI